MHFDSGSNTFISVQDRIQIRPKVSDPSGSGSVLGGFNVSNLMGITRRKIDIGKKITFYFLQNV
jgi:hypothetical protein